MHVSYLEVALGSSETGALSGRGVLCATLYLSSLCAGQILMTAQEAGIGAFTLQVRNIEAQRDYVTYPRPLHV